MSQALLPRESGIYTRAIADAGDTNGRLKPALDLIPQIGRTVVPDGWMPWLLRNAGLQALMPHVDWATLWAKGPAWLYIRGTPDASVQALSWIGWNIRFEDGPIGSALYDRYHIHLDGIPWRSELERLVAVEKIAKSADSIFFRLVHGYDVRPVKGGMSRYGRSIFGRHSGVDVRPDWPRLSFRANIVMAWPSSTRAYCAETLTLSCWADRRGDIVYGKSRYGSRSKIGPVLAMDLSDSAAPVGSPAAHRAVERVRPVAGVVGGRTRFASRQAVPYPVRLIPGETLRFARNRFGQRLRPADIECVLRVPDPVTLLLAADLSASATVHDSYTDKAFVLVDPSIVAADVPDGPVMVGALATLDDAPWSGLPWSDTPFGSSPRVQSSEETT